MGGYEYTGNISGWYKEHPKDINRWKNRYSGKVLFVLTNKPIGAKNYFSRALVNDSKKQTQKIVTPQFFYKRLYDAESKAVEAAVKWMKKHPRG